jgi:hypothetical protein
MTPTEVALLLAVIKPAANKLVSLIASEFASIVGVTKDLCELQGLFGDITAWLSAIEVRTSDSSSSPNWLKQLKAEICPVLNQDGSGDQGNQEEICENCEAKN